MQSPGTSSRTIGVELSTNPYRVVIGEGGLAQLGERLRELGIKAGTKVLVVTNPVVNEHYGATALNSLEAAAGLPEDEIARGETVLIAQLVALLITFIGEALTLRLLQEAWPEVSHSDLISGPETNE